MENPGPTSATGTDALQSKRRRFDRKEFVRPKPNRLLMAIMSPFNRYFIFMGIPGIRRIPLLWQLPILRDLPGPGSTAKVLQLDFPESEKEKFRKYINPGTAAFIGPNHPEFWTDWSLDKIFSDEISPRMAHWAWYGAVNANPYMQAFWLRNNLIANAPNGVEEGKRYAIDWVKKGYGNLLHPEGGVNLTADQVQTIFGGIIEMAIRTSEELISANDPRPVYAVPMLSKYHFVGDVSKALESETNRIEKKLGFESTAGLALEDRLFQLQKNILRQKLSELESRESDCEITPQNFFSVQIAFQAELLDRLRATYGERTGILPKQLRSYEKEVKKNRIKKRKGEVLTLEQETARIRYGKESAVIAEIRRLDSFKADVYGARTLTQEQIAETLKRTKRDLINFTVMDGVRNMMPVAVGWRKAILRSGEPIDVRAWVEAHLGSTEEFKEELVSEFRRRMQSKLDEIVASTKPATDRFARPNPFYSPSLTDETANSGTGGQSARPVRAQE